MKRIRTTNLFTGLEENFYVSDSVNLESFCESLSFIKTSETRWVRQAHKIEEIIENSSFGCEKKYISVKRDDTNQEEIYIFDKSIFHNRFAEIINFTDDCFRTKLGAGFTNGKECYGISESLNLPNRPGLDTLLLKS